MVWDESEIVFDGNCREYVASGLCIMTVLIAAAVSSKMSFSAELIMHLVARDEVESCTLPHL